jgi:CubicO group peptidase (beta-lactamase class C family)
VLEAVFASAGTVSALRSILVARNGFLVAERYYGGATSTQLLPINSVTKSVCSILVGQALAQGKLSSLSQTVGELLPDQAAKVPGSPASAITLRQILSGTTGLAYDYRTQVRPLANSAYPVQHVLELRHDGRPPNSWSYNDAAVSLLTPILEHAQGLPLRELARRDLFAPLGIDEFFWSQDRDGHPTAYMGLQLKTRDLLKLAWVMADAGRWRGLQVIPSEWVSESIHPKVNGVWRNPPVVDSGYGYLWFTGTLKGHQVAWAWGYGGQFAIVVPSLRLAIATAATNPLPQALAAQTESVMSVVGRIVEATP